VQCIVEYCLANNRSPAVGKDFPYATEEPFLSRFLLPAFLTITGTNHSMKQKTILPILLALLFVLSACVAPAPSTGSQQAAPQATNASTEPSEPSDDAAFPVTVEHKYGSTEISALPERVVSVGYRDHEHLLALGVVPVGVRDWYGNGYETIFWPWALDALGDAQPEIVGGYGEINFEAVALLDPDLIVGVYSGMTEDEYNTLSQIAPTVAQSGEYIDWGMPWQEEARMIGRAVGQVQKAEELIAEVEAGFVEARAAHPEFEGATIAAAQLNAPGEYYVLGPQDHKALFFTSLGFQFPDEIAEAVGEQSNLLISQERLDLLDQELLVWLVGSEQGWADAPAMADAARENPIYQQLNVVREGRDVFAELPADALAWSTPLSLLFALNEFVPLLADALNGAN
jgi:iron complex transport system substrate-binding protein